jgi:hypothetical protein
MENDWVSVKNDFPEYGEKVLWFCLKRGMYVKKYGPDDYPLKPTITHWQKLPSTPINVKVKNVNHVNHYKE